MRTTLLLLAALTSSTLTAQPTAEACGGDYAPVRTEPQVFPVSIHHVLQTGQQRAFVLFDQPAPEHTAWTALAPRSYDGTQIALAAQWTAPVTLTLVGPRGTRLVTTTRYVYLARTFVRVASALAVEVDAGDDLDAATIAIVGNHPTARYGALSSRTRTIRDEMTVRNFYVSGSAAAAAHVEQIAGTTIDAIGFQRSGPSAAGRRETVIRQGDTDVGVLVRGEAIGSVKIDGTVYLVLREPASTRLVKV